MNTGTPRPSPRRPDLATTVRIVRSFVRARVQLRGTRRGARVRCFGRVLVPRRRGVEIGQRTVFLGGAVPTELRCDGGAELVIGPRSLLNYGVSIVAQDSVRIGARCRIASFVHIRDSDGRRTRPVTIGDDVWIAHGAVIEPGTVIGDGAVVSAMAVVSGVVPPYSLAAGNPAQHIPLEGSGPRKTGADAIRDEVDTARPRASGRPSASEVRAVIIEWLDDTRHFGAAATLIRDDAMSLRAGGLLDSLGVVQLVLMLEKRFGVRIDREGAASRDAQSMNAFIALVTHSRENGL
jgi:maltose O-acetyltransferase